MTDTELLVKVYERQGETNAKLDAINDRLDAQDRDISRQGHRIRKLEIKWARMMGLFAVIGAGVTGLFNYLTRRNQA